jgi:hypothetical protein
MRTRLPILLAFFAVHVIVSILVVFTLMGAAMGFSDNAPNRPPSKLLEVSGAVLTFPAFHALPHIESNALWWSLFPINAGLWSLFFYLVLRRLGRVSQLPKTR